MLQAVVVVVVVVVVVFVVVVVVVVVVVCIAKNIYLPKLYNKSKLHFGKFQKY